MFREALEHVELADRLGIQHMWAVEHHFLDDHALSSAPEVWLAAAAARTTNIRIGHGIVCMPPGFTHPARVAERIATLDQVSGGRVEFGTGESSSRMELEGFGVDVRHQAGGLPRGARAGLQHDGDDAVPGLRRRVLLDAVPQRRAEAGAEAAPAAVGGRQARRRRAARHGLPRLQRRRRQAGQGDGRPVLPHAGRGVRADRPRRQPEHRRAGDAALPPRRRHRPAQRRAPQVLRLHDRRSTT